MNYIKLYEAYSEGDYKKALFKVKNMLVKKKSNDEVLAFVNKYASDDGKVIDSLRILLDRIYKKYFNYIIRVGYGAKYKRKHLGEEYEYYKNYKTYFAFTLNTSRERKVSTKEALDNALKMEKDKYDHIIKSIDNVDLDKIKFTFDRLFEILEWVNETGAEKHSIYYSNDNVIHRIEMLNTEFDFDNEVDEVKKLIAHGKSFINKAINSI